jgi:hypothetical protein
MAPKFQGDKDGDIPPCSVIWDFKAVDKWEQYKQAKYEFKERKAECSCRYFEGPIPSEHKCFNPIKKSTLKRIFYWIKYKCGIIL